MGFGSSFKKFVTGGVAGGALASATGGTSILAGVGAGGLLSALLGEDDSGVEGARTAGATEAGIAEQNLAFRKLLFGETAPFRERAGIASEELLARAQRPLSESEDFQRDLRESLVQQRMSLGAFGLGDSTTFAQAAGETTAELTSRERGRQTDILSFLAGGAETGIPGALRAQELATGAGLSRAQTQLGAGQLKAQVAGREQQSLLDLLGTGATLSLLK